MTTERMGHVVHVRFGNVEVRPLGGFPGCLAMIAISIAASVFLTFILNVVLR